MPRRLTTEEFIERVKVVHSDRYNYDKVEYINMYTKVCIVCTEHGEFWQSPSNHLSNNNCPECSKKRVADCHRSNKEEFVQKAREVHDDLYNYDKVKYTNNRTKVCIICTRHGEFWQVPWSHLNGHGCATCANESSSERQRSTTEEFIQKATVVHGERYNYDRVQYTNNRTKVCIICTEHGEFMQSPDNHLGGAGCPDCCNKSEAKCREIIEQLTGYDFPSTWPDFLRYVNGKNLQLDGYCAELNLAFEYNGIQHYEYRKFFHHDNEKRLEVQQERDRYKYDRLDELMINLIIIPYTCESDQEKEDFIIDELTSIAKERNSSIGLFTI